MTATGTTCLVDLECSLGVLDSSFPLQVSTMGLRNVQRNNGVNQSICHDLLQAGNVARVATAAAQLPGLLGEVVAEAGALATAIHQSHGMEPPEVADEGGERDGRPSQDGASGGPSIGGWSGSGSLGPLGFIYDGDADEGPAGSSPTRPGAGTLEPGQVLPGTLFLFVHLLRKSEPLRWLTSSFVFVCNNQGS